MLDFANFIAANKNNSEFIFKSTDHLINTDFYPQCLLQLLHVRTLQTTSEMQPLNINMSEAMFSPKETLESFVLVNKKIHLAEFSVNLTQIQCQILFFIYLHH